MSPTWPSSPVTEAIANVVETLSERKVARRKPQENTEYLVVSYQDDFEFLWSSCEENASQEINEENNTHHRELLDWILSTKSQSFTSPKIILVWDDTPAPQIVCNVHLANYVTPYDWGVALSVVLNDKVKQYPLAQTEALLYILDIAPHKRGTESASLINYCRFTQQPYFNQVRGYFASLPPQEVNSAEGLIKDIIDAQALPSVLTSEGSADKQDDWGVNEIKRLWVNRLLVPHDPRDRHAIANLVGPHLLLSALSAQKNVLKINTPLPLYALTVFMQVLGLLPENNVSINAPWINKQDWTNDFPETQFILLDDLAALGWEEFIRLALGVEKTDKQLLVFDDPRKPVFGKKANASLLDLLCDKNGLRLNQGLSLCGSATENVILFLDLRLFNRYSIQEEMAFFQRLLSLARQAKDNEESRKDLPWRGFSQIEIKAIENCIRQATVENDDYFIALTMLPRLLALVAPTLPIVLFSSTGQKRITEAIKGYGNLISDFDKPRFFTSNSTEIVEMAQARFERALSQALALLRGGAICKSLKAKPTKSRTNTSQYFVEIFLDESREITESDFRVGGIAIIYENEQQADSFNREIINHRLIWGPTDILPKPPHIILPKELNHWDEYETHVFSSVQNIIKTHGVKGIIGFSLATPSQINWSDPNDLSSPWCLDNIYKILVMQVLEAVIYEVIPHYLGQPNPDFLCGIYVAIRQRHKSDADQDDAWDSLETRYGVWRIDPQSYWSVTSDSVHYLVSQLQSHNPNQRVKIVAARGGKLFYGQPAYPLTKGELPRPAHYLADLAVRFGSNKSALQKLPTLNHWFSSGFVCQAEPDFAHLLYACRQGRQGDSVTAILHAHQALSFFKHGATLSEWARYRVEQSLNSLTGKDFIELCSRL